MENNRDQMGEKNNETITSTQENVQEHFQSTGRLNIEDINRRNDEERRKEKKILVYSSRNSTGSAYCDCVIFF
jgi:hypothetical protein